MIVTQKMEKKEKKNHQATSFDITSHVQFSSFRRQKLAAFRVCLGLDSPHLVVSLTVKELVMELNSW